MFATIAKLFSIGSIPESQLDEETKNHITKLKAALAKRADQEKIDILVEKVAWSAARNAADITTGGRNVYASFRGETVNLRTGRFIKQMRRTERGVVLVELTNEGDVKRVTRS